MLLEYDGDEYIRFIYLVKSLFTSLNIKNYQIYHGKKEKKIQIFIQTDDISLTEASKQLEDISNTLTTKMTKRWKLLPQKNLPDEYNIATLPYAKWHQ